MKVTFVVSIFLVLLVSCTKQMSCTKQTPQKNAETIKALAGQAIPGRIYLDVKLDSFKASNATIFLCDQDDTARWVREGTAEGKEIRIRFREDYRCILNAEYLFSDEIEIIINKDDFCNRCDLNVREAILNDGIEAVMHIRVRGDFQEVDGEKSPPRIIIGNPGLNKDCCPD